MAFYVATSQFEQLHMGLNVLPSPPRLCLRIRQKYLYNNILNKCKEGKLLCVTSTIKVYTFWELNNFVRSTMSTHLFSSRQACMSCLNEGGEVRRVGKRSVFFCLQHIDIYMSPVSMGCPADFSHLKSMWCQVVHLRSPNLAALFRPAGCSTSQHPGHCPLLGGNQHKLLPG